jgi:hypothetical protein
MLNQIVRKLMFFFYLCLVPAFRAIEFDDITLAIFCLKQIDTVFIAVKRGKTGIHPDPLLKQSIHDSIRV